MWTKILKVDTDSRMQLLFYMLRWGFISALICVASLTVLQEYNSTINLVVFNNIDK